MNINQFTEFLSNTIGWNKHNIQRRARSLREEGLIGVEVARHGRGARQIEIWDCCYILIAILADGNASNVGPIAKEIANTKITNDRAYCKDPLLELDVFKSSKDKITFIDSLCKIIDDLNNEKLLPAVEKISLNLNFFNPEDVESIKNSRIRIDWNTPLQYKQNLSKIAFSIKNEITELDNADQMGTLVQPFLEIDKSDEIPNLPDHMKLLQSNFGITFNDFNSLNNKKIFELKNKINSEKYLKAISDTKLFGSESLPSVNNHYHIGGSILALIAENYDKDFTYESQTNTMYSMMLSKDSVLNEQQSEAVENIVSDSIVADTRFFNFEKKEKKQNKRNIYLWDRDESILGWSLLLENKKLPSSKDDQSIKDLSEQLINIGKLKNNPIDEKYRNPSGVYLTIMNMDRFKKADEFDFNNTSNLGQIAQDLWLEFKENPNELILKAMNIKELIKKGIYEPLE